MLQQKFGVKKTDDFLISSYKTSVFEVGRYRECTATKHLVDRAENKLIVKDYAENVVSEKQKNIPVLIEDAGNFLFRMNQIKIEGSLKSDRVIGSICFCVLRVGCGSSPASRVAASAKARLISISYLVDFCDSLFSFNIAT